MSSAPVNKGFGVRESAWTNISHAALPMTKVQWSYLTAACPICKATSRMSYEMVAFPLSKNGDKGTTPDGNAQWWHYIHQTGEKNWVQGHLLNHHVHGPGEPDNLTPMSYAANSNMQTKGESFIKELVNKKDQVLFYRVRAYWEAGNPMKAKDIWQSIQEHATVLHSNPYLRNGECLVPSRISWEAWLCKQSGNDWIPDQRVTFPLFGSDDPQFYNAWPDHAPAPHTTATAVQPIMATVVQPTMATIIHPMMGPMLQPMMTASMQPTMTSVTPSFANQPSSPPLLKKKSSGDVTMQH